MPTFASDMVQKIKKLKEFEYWPFGVFYIPLYFYGFYLAFKSRSFMYFSTTNPGMKYGGVIGESKISVLDRIDAKYLPKTIFINSGSQFNDIQFLIKEKGLELPLIVKPNIGERGKGVEKIENIESLKDYLDQNKEDIILQEFIDYPVELGILYYRHPNEATGHISSVVMKEFLEIEGNGHATLLELIDSKPRAIGRREYLLNKYAHQLNDILPNGERIRLEPIGNHCRGTKFLNGNHLINSQLESVFDQIAKNIKGYNYGRFDLKVKSLEDLYLGKNIKILELNGVSSEPAHVYDPNMKLLNAYKDVFKHASIIQQIGYANHKKGVSYSPLYTFVKELISFLNTPKKDITEEDTTQFEMEKLA
ncbi:ATP-grasp domain-containing protein [Chondrinema litorale]|uniref:ATP-grasp domain-containing protein n=1 Tax=Chondrinema litorale TaxID=2994555 RepID=UPI00254297D4|nr:ATP-grasp domain-containing protein [Chondrinema litorale]UZR93186.1 ATP-grasp domain-containing protein [Chondrinema litorale]